MTHWTAFPYSGQYSFDEQSVRQRWPELHIGDCEPLPAEPSVLAAWALLHRGHFQEAAQAGLAAGAAAITATNKACCIYANYLERTERTKLDLFQEVARRAQAQALREPNNPNAWYWQAYALGRYSQGISVAKALAQGLGTRVKEALERTIELEPRHAEAHIALATFHAEVIDKVGPLIGSMTYGVSKDVGLKLYQQALRLHPNSPIALVEYADGLVMLEGADKEDEALALYRHAIALRPVDATDRLVIERARAQLQDGSLA